MNWKLMTAAALGVALFAGSSAQAASCKKDADCSAGQVCSAGTCTAKRSGAAQAADAVAPTSEATAGNRRTPYIGWGGLGGYDVGGSGGGSTTDFGFHVRGSANLLQITPELPLVGWGDAALTLGSDLFFPLAVGAGVRYDNAGPVQLIGGVGFAVLPHTASLSTSSGTACPCSRSRLALATRCRAFPARPWAAGPTVHSAVAISGLIPPSQDSTLGSGSGGTKRGGTATGGGNGQLVQVPRSGITRCCPSLRSDRPWSPFALRTAATEVLYFVAIWVSEFPVRTTCTVRFWSGRRASSGWVRRPSSWARGA